MKPYIQIAVGTGHLYEIASDTIALHRAKAMQQLHPDEFKTLDAALTDSRELFADDYNVIDWAKNNMDPTDYLKHARLVRFNAPVQDFDNANWTHHDAPAMSGELDGAQIMAQPVEAVMSAMAASRQICNITVLNNENSEPFGAAVMVLGDNNIVSAFVNALQFTSDHLTSAQPPVISH